MSNRNSRFLNIPALDSDDSGHYLSGWPWDNRLIPAPAKMKDGSPWPLVTIVTPSFNQAQFLEEAIRSVLLQGYPNLEYIIMDGGSTDGSVEIIEKYADFLSYWTSQKDDGQSDAINKGFKRAQGHYLAWLNSDDVLLPGAIHAVVQELHSDPLSGMAFAQVDVIDEKGRKVGIFEPVDYSFKDLLTMKIILPQQAAFFRKSAIEPAGFLRTDLHYAMDVELFIRIGASHHILPVEGTYAQFRLSTSNKGVLNKINWCSEFIKIVDDFFNHPELSQNYINLRKAAYGGAYYRGAHTYLDAENYSLSLQWLNRAAQYHPCYYLKPGWWKAKFLARLGKNGMRFYQKLLVWMRRNRLYTNETDWQTGIASNITEHKG